MGSRAPHVRPRRDPSLFLPFALASAVLLGPLAPGAATAADRVVVPASLRGQAGAASARALPTVIVSEADDGRSLSLRRGQQLQVLLAETAGTGYSWEIERLDRRLLQPEGQTTRPNPGLPTAPGLSPAPGLVGGPLQVSMLFRAVAAGEGELLLRHWRPWEGPASVDRRLRLRLRVVE